MVKMFVTSEMQFMKKISILLVMVLLGLVSNAANPVEAEATYGSCMPESRICIVRQTMDRSDKKVNLEIDFQLDSTYLKNMTWVSLTPIVRRDTIEKSLHPMLIMGRTQQLIFQREGVDERYGDDYQIVFRKERSNKEQVENWVESFDWENWMDSAKIYVRMENCGCGKVKGTEEMAVRPIAQPNPLLYVEYVQPEHQVLRADTIKEYDITGSAFVNFVVDRWEVRPTYMSNEREIKKITDTLDIVMADENITIQSIQIHGWASPESPYAHNKMLATNRAKALTDYVHARYNTINKDVFLPAKATPENWIGLVQFLREDGQQIEHAEQILEMIGDPTQVTGVEADVLERTIRDTYREDYNYMLANWYPSLRRSDYEIVFVVRSFDTDEARSVINDKPEQLSLYEMEQLAASYETFSEEYNRVFKTAYAYYGSELEEARLYRANVALHEGDVALAEEILSRCGESAAGWNARGIAALCHSRWDEARAAFRKAQALGANEAHNLEVTDALEAHPANQ